MRQAVWVIIFAIAVGWLSTSSASPAKTTSIVDVSWPNCTLKNPPKASNGIIGINGGLAFRPNPCLAKQTGWFKNFSVYINTGYPGVKRALKFQHTPKACAAANEKCLAYNYGYNSGLYSIKYSLLQGVIADRWWLDVETENSWSDSVVTNRSALSGAFDAVSRFAGVDRVGFYSYPGQWDLLTGNWHNNAPAWAATGSKKSADAVLACKSPAFTGGEVIISQYVPELDQNYICP